MYEPLDELYLRWLYGQVASVRPKNPAQTYWSLLRQLYKKEFVMIVPNDDNRVEDGRDLRYEFVDKTGVQVDPEWMALGCSFLEMLIGLSRRLSFEAEGGSRGWFWRLLWHLGIDECNDNSYEHYISEIDAAMDRVILRTFEPDGRGGLFPLKYPREDQREVEIWYQLSHYLLERVI